MKIIRIFNQPANKQGFVSNVFKLASGTAIAQIIMVIASPLLTRLFSPDDFGILALFTSITSIVGIMACLRYELAIMLPEKNEDAANILGLCLVIVCLISIISGIVIFFLCFFFSAFLNSTELSPFLFFIPVSIFCSGSFAALNYWNSRTKQFGQLAFVNITRSTTTIATQLGTGFAGFKSAGSLISGVVLGSITSVGILGKRIWDEHKELFRKSITWNEIIIGFKKYKKFPIFESSSALLNTISWQLPVILLTIFFSTTIAGYYSIGLMALQFPMSLIGGATAQVFLQKAVELKAHMALQGFVLKVFSILLKISMFPLLILTFIGESIFVVIFGPAWAEAGLYAQILSIWIIFWFISSPLSMIYVVYENQEFGLKANLVIFITRFVSLVIGGVMNNVIIALLLFSFSGAVVYGLFSIYLLKMSGISIEKIGKIFLSNIIIFIPAGIVLALGKYINVNAIFELTIGLILLFLYAFYLLKKDLEIKELLSRIAFS